MPHLLPRSSDSLSGRCSNKILRSCWIETSDSGVYEELGDDIKWTKLLVGDRFFALFAIRKATYPEEKYEFRVHCENRNCQEPIDWELDLDDLPVKKLPEESRKLYKDGNRFATEFADGTKIFFKLPSGEDEKKAQRFLRGDLDTIAALRVRLLGIGTGDNAVDISKWQDYLEDQEFADLRDLLEHFDEVDGGIETTIEVVCQDCAATQEVELPFGRDFFMPRKKKSKKKG